MLIKIDGERYLNTEHISMIAPGPDLSVWFICLLGQGLDATQIQTTAAVIAYLAMILDADENYSDDSVSLSLTSRIAIHLSNSAEPQTLNQLLGNTAWLSATSEDIETSLNILVADSVIRSELRDGVAYYSHAANAHPFENINEAELNKYEAGLKW